MLELKKDGKSVKEIARIFEVSPRTVQRWLKLIRHCGERERQSNLDQCPANEIVTPSARNDKGHGEGEATAKGALNR